MAFTASAIDLTNIPLPHSIEDLSYDDLYNGFIDRFQAFWATARGLDSSLPEFDVDLLQTDPAVIFAQAFSYIRLLDRARVNDGIKALLAPYSTGSDLDNLVARQNVQRLVVIAANGNEPEVLESDARLFQRYLLSFSLAAAGSRDAYIYHALTAWPAAGDVKVVGRAIHGRRGDVDIVVTGADGETPSDENLALVRAAVTATNVQPETTSVSVLAATRATYEVNLLIEVPGGPEPSLIEQAARNRVTTQALSRNFINGEIPDGLLAGAAYGDSVLSVTDNSPVVIKPDTYSVPVMTAITVTTLVRS